MLACHQPRITMYKYLHLTTFIVLSIVVWYVDYAFKVWWFVCIFFVAALLGSVSLQNCRVLSTCYSEWRFHWERRMLDRPTKQWEPPQGFLRNDNWWRYLGAFCFQVLIFFLGYLWKQVFFCFLMQRRLDDIVKRCWKESSVQLRSFCDFYWSTTTSQLETIGKFISVEILLLAITL